MALVLKRHGIAPVHPLAGGFHGWRDRGYPLMDFTARAGDPG